MIQIWKSVVGLGLEIILGMADARARAHHLDVAGLGAALVAQTVLVRDRTLADIGDDLHVLACGCGGNPALGAISSSFQTRRAALADVLVVVIVFVETTK